MFRESPSLPESETKITDLCLDPLFDTLFPFISFHLKSTIYITATSSLELSSSRCAAYQPPRDKEGNGGKTEGHHISLTWEGIWGGVGGHCSYCCHNSAWINVMFIMVSSSSLLLLLSSSSSSSPVLLCRRECWELGGLSAVDLEEAYESKEDKE